MERRAHLRIKIYEQITLITEDYEKQALACNISQSGLYIIFLDKLTSGYKCMLNIKDRALPGKIVWECKMNKKDKICKYGFLLDETLSKEELNEIIT